MPNVTGQVFKGAVRDAFVAAGFRVVAKNLRCDGPDASLIVELQKNDHDDRWFINAGFWLKVLSDEVPTRVELTPCISD